MRGTVREEGWNRAFFLFFNAQVQSGCFVLFKQPNNKHFKCPSCEESRLHLWSEKTRRNSGCPWGLVFVLV